MKSIAQLLQLSKNKFYKLTPEEQLVLDNFLSEQRAQKALQEKKSKDSSPKTRAIVKNKNIVQTEHGEVPEI